MNENNFKEESLKCLGCHSFKLITDFDYNKNNCRLKTCNKCRDRNKNRVRKNITIKQPQPVEIVLSEEEIEQCRISDMINNQNLILTVKTKNMFFRTLFTYTHSKEVKVEMLGGIDIYDGSEIIKMIFSLTRSMILIKCYDNWCKIKRLIDEELKTDKAVECSICLNSYDGFVTTCPRMRCVKCYNDYCIRCFLTLYEKNEGLIICPYCRNQSGGKVYGSGNIRTFIGIHLMDIVNNTHEIIPFNFSKAPYILIILTDNIINVFVHICKLDLLINLIYIYRI
jgi:hypothetical protein